MAESQNVTMRAYPKMRGVRILRVNIPSMLFIAGIIVLCCLFSYHEGTFSICSFAVIFAIIGTAVVRFANKDYDTNYFVRLFLYSYGARILTALLLIVLLSTCRGEPFLGGGDDYVYDLIGRVVGQSWASHGFQTIERTYQPGYYYVVAFYYYVSEYLGGGHQLVPIFFNCFLGALIPIYIYKIAFVIYEEKIAKTAASLVAFFPQFVCYSAVLLKETVILFCITLAMWHLVEFRNTKRGWNVAILCLALLPLVYFRMYILWLLFIYIVLFLLLTGAASQKRRFRLVMSTFVVGLLLGVIFSRMHGKEYIGFGGFMSQERVEYIIESQRERMSDRLTEESLGTQLLYNSPLPIRILLRPIFLSINPFPPWGSLLRETANNEWNSKMEVPGALIWYFLMPAWVIGLFYSIRQNRVTAFSIYGINLLLFFAVAYYNMSVRHRLMCMPAAMILASVGIHKTTYQSVIKFDAILIAFFVNAYLYLKYFRHIFPPTYLIPIVAMTALIFWYSRLRRIR